VIAVVITNLLYLGVALVVAVVGALIVVVRQRKPKSVEANVASFHKGLRALAPDDESERPAARPSWGGAHKPVLVRPIATGDEGDGEQQQTTADGADPEAGGSTSEEAGLG
jgi:hypothetical protein